MGQPKKLTHAQKIAKIENDKLASYKIQLVRLRIGLARFDDAKTWKWAALELYKELGREFPEETSRVRQYREEALNIAKEAQYMMCF